jgi:hypothetical protein
LFDLSGLMDDAKCFAFVLCSRSWGILGRLRPI